MCERDHGFADKGDAASCDDEAIGDVATGKGDNGHEAVSERADFSHAGEREISFVDEIVGQPGEQEIEEIVAAEVAEKSSPGRAMREDVGDAGRRLMQLLA